MNKILLPEFPGNNLLFHAISNGNIIDAVNLLESTPLPTQIKRLRSTLRMLMGPHLFTLR